MGKIIPDHALANLKLYKYSGVDLSIASKLFLNAYWTKFATLFPRNVAPNTITLTGLAMVAFNVATLIYYDPLYLGEKDGVSEPPHWVYFTWAAGLFFYQTFDACDGKQARRTGMAGPLGEMFDHGCDAINTTLEVILCLRALNLTRSWWTVASIAATAANFYLTTWEEYHTGTLFLGVFSGPVEGILIIVGIYVLTGLYGPTFWDTPFFSLPVLSSLVSNSGLVKIIPAYALNLPLNMVFMIFSAFGLLFNIATGYGNVHRKQKAADSMLMPVLRLAPFCISVLLHVAFLSSPLALTPNLTSADPNNDSIVHSGFLLPYMCFWGLEFAHQVGRMITAHVTKTDFPYWDPMWVWIVLGALDGHAGRLFGIPPLIQSTPARQEFFVYLSLAISIFSYGRFCTYIIQDITEYLGIACFTVRKKDDKGEWKHVWELENKKN